MHQLFSEDNSLSIGLYRNSVLLWRLVAIALAKEVRPPVNKAKVMGWVVPLSWVASVAFLFLPVVVCLVFVF